jgi:hypothetical protein
MSGIDGTRNSAVPPPVPSSLALYCYVAGRHFFQGTPRPAQLAHPRLCLPSRAPCFPTVLYPAALHIPPLRSAASKKREESFVCPRHHQFGLWVGAGPAAAASNSVARQVE